MFWRLGENIDPSYLQMVILSHIAFVCFYSLFNKVMEKVWTKKKKRVIGKELIFAKFWWEICILMQISQ